MKNIFFTLFILSSYLLNAQKADHELKMHVLRETLPQLLNNNPNSIAFYLKGGGFYNLMIQVTETASKIDPTIDTNEVRVELDKLSDSVYVVLENHKIKVSLIDTLFTLNYKPSQEEMNDGTVETTDLREPETWSGTKEFLTEIFQENYEFNGFDRPVKLEFIDLIYAQLNLNSKEEKINLAELNNSYYEFCTREQIQDTTLGRSINGIRLYKPVFNKRRNKACYLFTYQAANGPHREFVFVEKKNGKWLFVDTYGSDIFLDDDD